MPVRYLSTVLRGLDGIYQFVSSQRGAPEEVELDLPIQVVSDVSRMAEYGTGLGLVNGWTIAALIQTHTVTGQLLSFIDPATPTNALFGWPASYDRETFMPWVYNSWMTSDDNADFSAASAYIRYQIEMVGPAGTLSTIQNLVLSNYDGTVLVPTTTERFGTNLDSPSFESPMRPIPMPGRSGGISTVQPNLIYASISDSGGTISFDWNTLLWIGSRFANPPLG